MASSQEASQPEPDSQAFPVKSILAENEKRSMYYIEWEGVDPEKGEPWQPTWEPYDCVSASLRREWEAQKRLRQHTIDVNEQKRLEKQLMQKQDIMRAQAAEAKLLQDQLDRLRDSPSQSQSQSEVKPTQSTYDESTQASLPALRERSASIATHSSVSAISEPSEKASDEEDEEEDDDEAPIPAGKRRGKGRKEDSPDYEPSPPRQPRRQLRNGSAAAAAASNKRKRASMPASGESYRPSTQSATQTTGEDYSTSIGSQSVNALLPSQAQEQESQQGRPVNRRQSAPAPAKRPRITDPEPDEVGESSQSLQEKQSFADSPRTAKKIAREQDMRGGTAEAAGSVNGTTKKRGTPAFRGRGSVGPPARRGSPLKGRGTSASPQAYDLPVPYDENFAESQEGGTQDAEGSSLRVSDSQSGPQQRPDEEEESDDPDTAEVVSGELDREPDPLLAYSQAARRGDIPVPPLRTAEQTSRSPSPVPEANSMAVASRTGPTKPHQQQARRSRANGTPAASQAEPALLPASLRPKTASTSEATIVRGPSGPANAPSGRNTRKRAPARSANKEPSYQQPEESMVEQGASQGFAGERASFRASSPERRGDAAAGPSTVSTIGQQRGSASRSAVQPRAAAASAAAKISAYQNGHQPQASEAPLPRFRKKGGDGAAREATPPGAIFSRNGVQKIAGVDSDGWPHYPSTEAGQQMTGWSRSEQNDSTVIVPDSQQPYYSQDGAARSLSPGEQDLSLPPPLRQTRQRHSQSDPPRSQEQQPRQTSPFRRPAGRIASGPPGSRLAAANIEKPRPKPTQEDKQAAVGPSRPLRRVTPPRPSTFAPYLPPPQPSQDSIVQFSSPPTAAPRHGRASAGALDAAAQRAQDRRFATDEDAEYERDQTDVREELRRAMAGEPPAPTTRARKAKAAARARLSEASASRTTPTPAVQVQEPYSDDQEPTLFEDGCAGGSTQAQAEGQSQPQPRPPQAAMPAAPVPTTTLAEAPAPSTSAPPQTITASSTDVQSALPIIEVTGAAPGAASGAVVGAVVSLPSKVTETSNRAPLARAKIKTGGLLTDEMKNDLLTFLEAPEYYIASELPLTARPNWIIRIEDLAADEGEGGWYIILDMVKPEWRLEKRESATPAGGASATSTGLRRSMVDLKQSNRDLMSSLSNEMLRNAALRKEAENREEILQRSVARIEALESEKSTMAAELALLKQQLTTGLAQVALLHGAKEGRAEAELEKANAELEYLREAARMTDVVRTKAALAEELLAKEELRLAQAAAARSLGNGGVTFGAIGGHDAEAGLMTEEDTSDDGDFAGSDGDDDSETSSSEDEALQQSFSQQNSLQALREANGGVTPPIRHLAAPAPFYPDDVEAGFLVGGLATISPGPPPAESPDAQAAVTYVEAVDRVLHIANVATAADLSRPFLPAPFVGTVVAAEDTSGETTEQTTITTTTATGPSAGIEAGGSQDLLNTSDSQGIRSSLSSNAAVLAVDSQEYPGDLVKLCEWGRLSSQGGCTRVFRSDAALTAHVDEHIDAMTV